MHYNAHHHHHRTRDKGDPKPAKKQNQTPAAKNNTVMIDDDDELCVVGVVCASPNLASESKSASNKRPRSQHTTTLCKNRPPPAPLRPLHPQKKSRRAATIPLSLSLSLLCKSLPLSLFEWLSRQSLSSLPLMCVVGSTTVCVWARAKKGGGTKKVSENPQAPKGSWCAQKKRQQNKKKWCEKSCGAWASLPLLCQYAVVVVWRVACCVSVGAMAIPDDDDKGGEKLGAFCCCWSGWLRKNARQPV